MRVWLVLILSLTSVNAFADGLLKIGFLYWSSQSGSGSSVSQSSRMLTDITGAYVWPKGWAAGLLYGMDNYGGDASVSRVSYGPTFGWISRRENGPYLFATYHYTSTYDKYEGDGLQGDLGYKFLVRKFTLGFQMSYKAFSYKKLDGQKLSEPYKQTKLDPYFILAFEF